MLYLGKKHNPEKNAYLIQNNSDFKIDMKKAVQETNEMFTNLMNSPIAEPAQLFSGKSLFGSISAKASSLFLSRPSPGVPPEGNTIFSEDGKPCPEWKPRLDHEYDRLHEEIEIEVSVADFGAAGDGVQDDTEAFRKAIGYGRRKIFVPEGTYVVKGIRLPSWTILLGAGKGRTILRLHDSAPKGTRLVTNSRHWRGDHHIAVEGMTLDWNAERIKSDGKTSTWGNHSSCLTYAHVTYGWVRKVEAVNAGLHGFDVSATLYNYTGDGYRAKRGSRYIWLDQLNGYGFGDDGITTHHSDHIFISNCHMCDPSGRAHQKGFSNSNGIEVDDGSRHVWLAHNSTARCFGGVEVKAHHNSSAGNNVQIIGHLSVHDNRSFNFRHIGHHKASDPNSQTACNIRATQLVSISPRFTDLYESSPPRAMVVSAYRNVAINYFTVIGDPSYDYKHQPLVSLQYKARNIAMKHVSIRQFSKAGSDIKIFGGDNHADQITLSAIRHSHSAPIGIVVGKGPKNISITDVQAIGDETFHAIKASSPPDVLKNIYADGYHDPVIIGNKKV